MKNRIYIIASALLVVAVVVCLWAVGFFFGWPQISLPEKGRTQNKTITIYDAQGNALISTDNGEDIYASEYWAYLEVVLTELTQIIAEKQNCDTLQAQKELFAQEYAIYTSFDKVAFEAL